MLLPMFGLTLLIFLVGIRLVLCRIASVKNRDVSISYYRFMAGNNVPEKLLKTANNFSNLFETPLLFYIVCTLYISLGIESNIGVIVAWAYVALRCVHSYIHLTNNNVIHRMYAFLASLGCIFFLWVELLLKQI